MRSDCWLLKPPHHSARCRVRKTDYTLWSRFRRELRLPARPDTGLFDFPDLTFAKSGVTSKGLKNYIGVGNHSALSYRDLGVASLPQSHSVRAIWSDGIF